MQLIKGDIYFTVTFEDKDLRIPIVQTLEFISENENSNGEDVALFRHHGSNERDKIIFVRKSDFDRLLVDQEGLLTLLMKAFAGKLGVEGM